MPDTPARETTPGPWTIRAGSGGLDVEADDGHVATCEIEADARAISALPDLLDAAQLVLAGLNDRIDAAVANGKPTPVFAGIARLHDAIFKATGG